MQALQARDLESDQRFPSGPWTGFFLQRVWPGRSPMNLDMTFQNGQLEATGIDRVGPFTFAGNYNAADGSCRWTKQYIGKHCVSYEGKNDGRGIWGVWQISLLWGLFRDQGAFHLWPKGMEPPDDAELTERAFLGHPGTLRGVLSVVLVSLVFAGLAAGGMYLLLRLVSFYP